MVLKDGATFIDDQQIKLSNHTQQLIVRFKQYLDLEYVQEQLYKQMPASSLNNWQWVDRKNLAIKYQSDFGIVQVFQAHEENLMDQISRIGFVKDIYRDTIIRKNILDLEEDAKNTKRQQKRNVRGKQRQPKVSGLNSVQQLGAKSIWDRGFKGQGIKVGVFDTGIAQNHPHIKHLQERTNFTNEDTFDDEQIGHGTFVAGVISSSSNECPGFAPEATIITFRVFTNDVASYTSWFLDAFNYAMAIHVDVINLSIGGPDYLDRPFVEKVQEISSNGIVMVSAIGNEGPTYGTLNNPADQSDVIGVGGIEQRSGKNEPISYFSSRGMSLWELPKGYGRVKPDVVAYGNSVLGSDYRQLGQCRLLSGTSVSSPIVAGIVALLASTVPEHKKKWMLNPAVMKQALISTATTINDARLYEQGAGKVNIEGAYNFLQSYDQPRTYVFPSNLDFTNCPYMWPFCKSKIYATSQPVVFNATVINALNVVGKFREPPVFVPNNEAAQHLRVSFEYSNTLWPWSGYLAIFITVKEEASNINSQAEGVIKISIQSRSQSHGLANTSSIEVPLKINIIPTPPREKRLLWDQFHSLKYPPGYIPSDDLQKGKDSSILDWFGDHPHTNFNGLFDYLTTQGYFLEILGSPYVCFDAYNYGALVIVDPEDEFYENEISKLYSDVIQKGLGLIVFADWYSKDLLQNMHFFDDNTRSWWTPETGGSNLPALNKLLQKFQVQFGDNTLIGKPYLTSQDFSYSSGCSIRKVPQNSYIAVRELTQYNKNFKRSRALKDVELYNSNNKAQNNPNAHQQIRQRQILQNTSDQAQQHVQQNNSVGSLNINEDMDKTSIDDAYMEKTSIENITYAYLKDLDDNANHTLGNGSSDSNQQGEGYVKMSRGDVSNQYHEQHKNSSIILKNNSHAILALLQVQPHLHIPPSQQSLRSRKLYQDNQGVGTTQSQEHQGVDRNGRIVLYGDSSCLETNPVGSCYDFFKELVKFVTYVGGLKNNATVEMQMKSDVAQLKIKDLQYLKEDWENENERIPEYVQGKDLKRVSLVLNEPMQCYSNSLQIQQQSSQKIFEEAPVVQQQPNQNQSTQQNASYTFEPTFAPQKDFNFTQEVLAQKQNKINQAYNWALNKVQNGFSQNKLVKWYQDDSQQGTSQEKGYLQDESMWESTFFNMVIYSSTLLILGLLFLLYISKYVQYGHRKQEVSRQAKKKPNSLRSYIFGNVKE